MIKRMLYMFCLSLLVCTTGCAGCRNEWAMRGGVLGAYEGNFVVVRHSGGRLIDVWVLRNSYVKSEENSDGWNFRDNEHNAVSVGGDIKVIRVAYEKDLDGWAEYHADTCAITYEEWRWSKEKRKQ